MNFNKRDYRNDYFGKSLDGGEYTFIVGEFIAKGGNGLVYNVNCEKLNGDYVIKILNQHCQNQPEKRDRFLREVKTVIELNKYFKNKYILNIVDYKLTETLDWYVMPKAICLWDYIINNKIGFKEKYAYILQIAECIKAVHEMQYVHRDIKPQNIFIKDNNIYLSDFGLVWNEDFDSLTKINEGIGPQNTKPPECVKGFAYKKTNMFLGHIDVYEFAKTVWMILTENKMCFSGEYKRERKDIFLTEDTIINNDYDELQTLEPLHEFLELATKDHFDSRPDIDKCYLLLNELIEANKDTEKIKEYNLIALDKKIQITSRPDGYKYLEVFTIATNINLLSSMFYIYLPQYSIKILINDCQVINKDLKIINIIDDRNNEYLIKVHKLEINYGYDKKRNKLINNINLDIESIELENINGYENVENLEIFPGILFNNQKIFLNKDTVIEFVKK